MNETETQITNEILKNIANSSCHDRLDYIHQYHTFLQGVQMRIQIVQQAKITGTFLTEGE